ncbi:MAG: hypothetical protein LBC92_00935, partial [Rickettsiales bacterium]|nr:hypothetical protein [Rickettsiales bacterium]
MGNFYDIGFFSYNKIRLGFDLAGGYQLKIVADSNAYIRNKLENITISLKNEFRKEKIKIIPKLNDAAAGNNEILISNGNNDIDKIKKIISILDSNLVVVANGDDLIVKYSDDSIISTEAKLLLQTIEIIKKRLSKFSLSAPIIQISNNNEIIIQFSRYENFDKLKRISKKVAKITFHAAHADVNKTNSLQNNIIKLKDKDGYERAIESEILLSGDLLDEVKVTSTQGNPSIMFTFNVIGAERFADITKKNLHKMLAIVIDDNIIATPMISSIIFDGKGVITGDFTVEEVNEISALLEFGSLPTALNIIEEKVVVAPFSVDNIVNEIKIGVVGFVFVLIFLSFLYRSFGVLIDFIIIFNLLTSFAILSLFNVTLTLFGIYIFIPIVIAIICGGVLIFKITEKKCKTTQYNLSEDNFISIYSMIFNIGIAILLLSFCLYIFSSNIIIKEFTVIFAVNAIAFIIIIKLLLNVLRNNIKI